MRRRNELRLGLGLAMVGVILGIVGLAMAWLPLAIIFMAAVFLYAAWDIVKN